MIDFRPMGKLLCKLRRRHKWKRVTKSSALYICVTCRALGKRSK